MKKIFYTSIVFIFLGVTTLFSQNLHNFLPEKTGEPSKATHTISSQGFSPHSAFLLMDIYKLKKEKKTLNITDSTIIDKYNLFLIADELYVNSFLVVSEEFDKSDFEKNGFFINTQSNNIVTASIPVNKLENVIEMKGVLYVQIAEKVHHALEKARSATWVDMVHQGQNLPQSYFGNGVVIGIIDNGFDYTHMNFFDVTGTNNYRVKRVWEQNATSGTPPSGFSDGRELTTQTAILNAQKDIGNFSHGTHVAGIAAGAGGWSSSPCKGVAPQSDLVFVSTTMTDQGIANGIYYIMNYALSVNKPCVINMSLAKHIGPHDGLSAFDQWCDGVVGPGRLLVGAAGNGGSDYIYNEKTFTSTDSTFYTFIYFPYSTKGTNGITGIDIWGDPNKNYQVAVNIYNSNTDKFEDFTPYLNANTSYTNSYNLYDDDFLIRDVCKVQISTGVSNLNNKSNAQINIDHTAQDDNYRWAMLEIKATSGKVRMWVAIGQAEFYNNGYYSPVQGGMTKSTVGEIGGTGKSIISVGAYNTTVSQIGDIASFSSKGPTADNRTKPDITAPGNRVISSVSRFDANYLNGGSNWNDVAYYCTNGTNTWHFAKMQGTSMAAPMVTGIIALWLQAYPTLNPTQALKLLKNNAWIDSYTGTISSNGSNTWGWGKVDAHGGLKDLLPKIPPKPTITPTGSVVFCQGQSVQLSASDGYSAYQWSNDATTRNITVSNAGNYSVRVMDSQGYISPWSTPTVVKTYSSPSTPTITVDGNVLTSSATSGNQWYYNGDIISGATERNYIAEQSGNYYVVVTNSNNCTARSKTMFIKVSGIENFTKIGTISIYPNPTDEFLNIQYTVDAEMQLSIELVNTLGQKMSTILPKQKQQIGTHILRVPISDFSVGIYFLIIKSDNQTKVEKIIIN